MQVRRGVRGAPSPRTGAPGRTGIRTPVAQEWPPCPLPEQFGRIHLSRCGQSDRLTTPISAELPKWAAMSENSGTPVLEDGQKEAWIRASDLRPLLAAMTAAAGRRLREAAGVRRRDGGRTDGVSSTRSSDRNVHFTGEVQRVTRELVRHGRLDERLSRSPGQGSLDDPRQRREPAARRAGGPGGERDPGAGRGGRRRPDPAGRPARRQPAAARRSAAAGRGP